MSTVPEPSGALAVMVVLLTTVKPAEVLPKSTVVPFLAKREPVMVTWVPTGPLCGSMDFTTGISTAKVKTSAESVGLVPSVAVTVTLTLPGDSAGDTVEMARFDWIVKGTDTDPKLTETAFRKSDPAMVTLVPPVSEPILGVTLWMVGPA